MRLMLAMRVFFAALFRPEIADGLAALLSADAHPSAEEPPEPQPVAVARPAVSPRSRRSDALTFLSALQRDARFVDLVSEPLGDYSDAQIGAAARDVLRDCHGVLERMFGLRPLLAEDEGAEVVVEDGLESGRYKLTGNLSGQPPFRGRLVHHGWEATKCELPSWSGNEEAARVVSSAEVQIS